METGEGARLTDSTVYRNNTLKSLECYHNNFTKGTIIRYLVSDNIYAFRNTFNLRVL